MLGRELQCPQMFHISGEGWEGGCVSSCLMHWLPVGTGTALNELKDVKVLEKRYRIRRHSFSLSVPTCLLSSYCAPGTMLGTGVNRREPCFHGTYISKWGSK